MRQITLNIQESKFLFFMELIRSLDFVSFNEKNQISEKQKEIVMQRIKDAEKAPERLLEWEKVKHKIKF